MQIQSNAITSWHLNIDEIIIVKNHRAMSLCFCMVQLVWFDGFRTNVCPILQCAILETAINCGICGIHGIQSFTHKKTHFIIPQVTSRLRNNLAPGRRQVPSAYFDYFHKLYATFLITVFTWWLSKLFGFSRSMMWLRYIDYYEVDSDTNSTLNILTVLICTQDHLIVHGCTVDVWNEYVNLFHTLLGKWLLPWV